MSSRAIRLWIISPAFAADIVVYNVDLWRHQVRDRLTGSRQATVEPGRPLISCTPLDIDLTDGAKVLELYPRIFAALYVTVVVVGFTMVEAYAEQPPLPDPLEAGWNGESVCEQLHDDAEHRVLRCSFPPSVGHERHFHRRYFGYAIAGGRVRITDSAGIREVDLATGSHFASDGIAWHEVLNIGDSTIVYLLVEPK